MSALDLLQWIGVVVLLMVAIVLFIRSRKSSRPSGECMNCAIKDECRKRGKRGLSSKERKSEGQ